MKQANFATLSVAIIVLFLSSCKKDPQPGEPTLSSGRCAISFTGNVNFETSNKFAISNTAATTATSLPFGTGSAREIKLEAVETTNGSLTITTRSVLIDILLSGSASTANGSVSIDLHKTSGIPLATITLKSTTNTGGFQTGGTNYYSKSGTITITKLTTAEIEGSFTGTWNDNLMGNLSISNGAFAGKF